MFKMMVKLLLLRKTIHNQTVCV